MKMFTRNIRHTNLILPAEKRRVVWILSLLINIYISNLKVVSLVVWKYNVVLDCLISQSLMLV